MQVDGPAALLPAGAWASVVLVAGGLYCLAGSEIDVAHGGNVPNGSFKPLSQLVRCQFMATMAALSTVANPTQRR